MVDNKSNEFLKGKSNLAPNAAAIEFCIYLTAFCCIFQEYYKTPELALDAVRLGEAWGALYFTENFTDALVARMALGREADEETLDQSEIRVWLDMSSKESKDNAPFVLSYSSE